MAKKKEPVTVQMHNNLNPVKPKPANVKTFPEKQKPSKKELDAIQSGVNKAGQQAVKEMHEGVPESAVKMAARLDKLDAFLDELIKEEGTEVLDPPTLTEMLMIKARHNAFVHCAETNPNAVLVWLMNIVLFNADAVFGATKAHLLAQAEEEKNSK